MVRARSRADKEQSCPRCGGELERGVLFTDAFGFAFYEDIHDYTVETSLMIALKTLKKNRLYFSDKAIVWNCRSCKEILLPWELVRK